MNPLMQLLPANQLFCMLYEVIGGGIIESSSLLGNVNRSASAWFGKGSYLLL